MPNLSSSGEFLKYEKILIVVKSVKYIAIIIYLAFIIVVAVISIFIGG